MSPPQEDTIYLAWAISLAATTWGMRLQRTFALLQALLSLAVMVVQFLPI